MTLATVIEAPIWARAAPRAGPVEYPSLRAAALPLFALCLVRDLGRDEYWLQDWLCEDLERLGLGPLTIVEQEQTQVRGGQLDILAANGDTYYSIEVQLGEVDASHGFRTFDYWARNRRRFPGARHVAVLAPAHHSGDTVERSR